MRGPVMSGTATYQSGNAKPTLAPSTPQKNQLGRDRRHGFRKGSLTVPIRSQPATQHLPIKCRQVVTLQPLIHAARNARIQREARHDRTVVTKLGEHDAPDRGGQRTGCVAVMSLYRHQIHIIISYLRDRIFATSVCAEPLRIPHGEILWDIALAPVSHKI